MASTFFTNSSISLLPTPGDLLWAFPRIGSSIVDFFGFVDMPWLNSTAGNETSEILATSANAFNHTMNQRPPPVLSASPTSMGVINSLWSAIQRVSNLDGLFSYLWSRWAITTVIVAVILNRAHVFASTREPVHSNWRSRLLLRIVPTLLLAQQALIILQTMRCQTGFPLPQIRFTHTDAPINKSWVNSPGFYYHASSILLFWQSTEDSCLASGMVPHTSDSMDFRGSSTVLWPLFLVLGLSQLAEVVASALRGQQPRPETGMSIFEHSLAFAEAETIARAAVGIGFFGLPQPTSAPSSTGTTTSVASPAASSASAEATRIFTATRPMVLEKLNVPPEVLVISLISCCSHLSSQILAIAGLQRRFRLINTGVWGSLFLILFFHSFFSFARPANIEDIYIIRYPTVCIIGFIPHMLTFIGALICAQVYASAILATLISSPRQWHGKSFLDKVKLAHANMSASASWSSVTISMTDDFYHFLLRIGYQILMAAAEAVYFNEGLQVTLSPETWLERARYDEAIKAGRTRQNLIPLELQNDLANGDGFGLVDEPPQNGPDGMPLPSGYARERKTMQHLNKSGSAAIKEEGVGIAQRSGRWYTSWKLIEQTSELVGYCAARAAISCWETVIPGYRPPAWLLEAANIREPAKKDESESVVEQVTLPFWRLTKSGDLREASEDSSIDVEVETRKRFIATSEGEQAEIDESELDDHLYDWWRAGGWWGENDSSAEYRPLPKPSDLDTTSFVSVSSSASSLDSDSSADSDVTIVPRRRYGSYGTTPSYRVAREAQTHLDDLAVLLDPKSPEEKQEARLLAQRLRSPDGHSGVMTRSRYRRRVLEEKLRGLPGSSSSPLLNQDDERLLLQHLIDSKRRPVATNQGQAGQKDGQSWREGGAGMGEGGPQCAVCQSSPRTVLVWPCRCLSLCEECRVQLAESNFATCVCCRRDVVAFSRLFVP